MEIRLLGARAFSLDGRPWPFIAPPRTIELLACLVVARGPVRRELLAATLWPDDDAATARANLRRHLYRLNTALPPASEPWTRSDAAGICWTADAWIDVLAFDAAHAANDHAAAVAVYQGDFLAGIDAEWIASHRARMQAAYIEHLEALLQSARAAGDRAAAIAHAETILAFDEWREDVVRMLMETRYASGDRAGALALYERFAAALRIELRLDPMPETQALRERIERHEPNGDTRELPQLDALSPRARSVAERAAVAAPRCTLDFLREAIGWSEALLFESISELIDRRVLRTTYEGSGYGYAFTDDRIREILYDAIPSRERERMHRRFARVLERSVSDDPAMAHELARHYELGREPGFAAAAYLRAAEFALSTNAPEAARAAAFRALALDHRDAARYLAYRIAVLADERLGDARLTEDLQRMQALEEQQPRRSWIEWTDSGRQHAIITR